MNLIGNQENLQSPNIVKSFGLVSPTSKENMPSENFSKGENSFYFDFNMTSSTPKSVPLVKQNSEEQKLRASLTEKRIKEILAFFNANYVKLSNLILRDSDFVEWEPKVVSAATIAFLRAMNKIHNVWSPELETISQMKYEKIATCYLHITKKFKNQFAPPKATTLIPKLSTHDLKLNKTNSLSKPPMTHRPESTTKLNLQSVSFQKTEVNSYTIDLKAKPKVVQNGESVKRTILGLSNSNSENMPPKFNEAQSCKNANNKPTNEQPKQIIKFSIFGGR